MLYCLYLRLLYINKYCIVLYCTESFKLDRIIILSKILLKVIQLTLCLLEFFHEFVVCWYFFFQNHFFFRKKHFRNTISVSNSLGPDQDRRSVSPDLGPNCLQRLSADNPSRQKKTFLKLFMYLNGIDKMRKPKMLKPPCKNSNQVKSYASFKIMQISI